MSWVTIDVHDSSERQALTVRVHLERVGRPTAPVPTTTIGGARGATDGQNESARPSRRTLAQTSMLDDPWFDAAERGLAAACEAGQPFEVYDLVTTYGVPEPPVASYWATCMRRASQRRCVRRVGEVRGGRPGSRGPVGLWVSTLVPVEL